MAADRYTHGHHSSVVAQHASRTVENCANFLIPHLEEDFALLDVGCGPGSITRGFAKYVKSVTGVDNSESVIAQAQKALSETGSEGIEFQTASRTLSFSIRVGSSGAARLQQPRCLRPPFPRCNL